MSEDIPNVVEMREESSGGRSSVVGHIASRQRKPKRSLRTQGSAGPTTPFPKRFSARPRGAPVKAPPSEKYWSAETELEAARTRFQLRESWHDSSGALQLYHDDFEKPNETERNGAVSEGVKEVTEALEEAQLEELQEGTTEAEIEAKNCEEAASLRQHHNGMQGI